MTQRQIYAVLGALMLGMLLAALDQTIVATSLPTIVGDLGGLNQLSWVVTSYLLASTVSTPLYGKLGDLYGRKFLFQAAIVIFIVGSMLAGLSQNMLELIGFRAIQGIGAGGLMVGAQAIIGDVVPPRERGKYQGWMGGVFALASVAGPVLGGFLTDDVSWRWIFYINVPIAAVALFVTATVLKTTTRRVSHNIDWLGAFFLAAGASSLILMTTWGGTQYAWASFPIIGLGDSRRGDAGGFVVVERRVTEPILPFRLFRIQVFNVASSVGFVIGFAMFGAITFLPVFLQLVDGASATSSGLNILPLMAGLLVASISSGQIISRRGRYKIFPVIGTALAAIGVFLLSTIDPTTPRFCPLAVHGGARPRSRLRHAGSGHRRPERCGATGSRRRHQLGDVPAFDGCVLRRRDLRCDLQQSARLQPARRTCPRAHSIRGSIPRRSRAIRRSSRICRPRFTPAW